MPMDAGVSFGMNDLLNLVGTMIVMLSLAFGYWKWQDSKNTEMESRVDGLERDLLNKVAVVSTLANTVKEQARADTNRLEHSLQDQRREFAVHLAAIPTRDHIDQLLKERVAPLEQDMRNLVIELARSSARREYGESLERQK